jgi:Uma2 family endonuclease
MAAITQPDRPRLSIADFRAFAATRPDEEHWELIDGAAMMMAPPTKAHQRIASNLERLLNDALQRSNPSLAAYQRVGLNLAPVSKDYDPEPDVVVIEADDSTDERYADRFYLVAEIVSASDRKKLGLKRRIYKLHKTCTCILAIRQDRYEVRVDQRTDAGWGEVLLQRPNDVLVLADFGVRCTLADLYSGTPLNPRRSR